MFSEVFLPKLQEIAFNKTSLYVNENLTFSSPDERRRLIRKALREKYALKDFNPAPFFSSISHTGEVAGFALSQEPIGFDMEFEDREISDKALERIASKRELDLFSEPIKLWVAKESAFKALRGPGQPPLIQDIEFNFSSVPRHTPLGPIIPFKSNYNNDLELHGETLVFKFQRLILGLSRLLT